MLICVYSSDLSKVTEVDSLDWEIAISKIADMILQEQSPQRLLAIRQHLYDLIIKCIQPSLIIKKLTFYLLDKVDPSLKLQILEKAAFHVSIR